MSTAERDGAGPLNAPWLPKAPLPNQVRYRPNSRPVVVSILDKVSSPALAIHITGKVVPTLFNCNWLLLGAS
jgi:hypothetical protein